VPNNRFRANIDNGGTARIAGGIAAYQVLCLGLAGEGHLEHTGGEVCPSGYGYTDLAVEVGGRGTYLLSGEASLGQEYLNIGIRGWGEFTQTGGTNFVGEYMRIGTFGGAEGRYLHSGGTLTVDQTIIMANGGGSMSRYELSGTAELTVNGGTCVGHRGTADFLHMDGTHTPGYLQIGADPTADGSYEMHAGSLNPITIYAGDQGTGRLTQTGGDITANRFYLGGPGNSNFDYEHSDGLYTAAGGSLTVNELWLGLGPLGRGAMDIPGGGCRIQVSEKLTFGPRAELTARPGARIRLAGTELRFDQPDPAEVAGLGNLQLQAVSGVAQTLNFEVACKDLGPVAAGFQDNLALGALIVGGDDVGQVVLLDFHDDQPDHAGAEALYVEYLVLKLGSVLMLGGRNLYYKHLVDEGGIVLPGKDSLTQVAEFVHPGDVDDDGSVNIFDAFALNGAWGSSAGDPSYLASADFDGDGSIDQFDGFVMNQNWGWGPPSTSAAHAALSVPEPCAAIWIIVGSALTGWRRLRCRRCGARERRRSDGRARERSPVVLCGRARIVGPDPTPEWAARSGGCASGPVTEGGPQHGG